MAFLRYNSHHGICLSKLYNLMVFPYIHRINFHYKFRTFSSPTKENSYLLANHSLLATINFSLALDLPILDISYKQNHTMCSLLWFFSLSMFSRLNYPCCSIFHYFIPFYAWMIFHCIDVCHTVIVYPFISCWVLGFFPTLGLFRVIVLMNSHVQVLCEHMFSFLLVVYLRMELLGYLASMNSMFNFLRNHQTVAEQFYITSSSIRRL